MNSTRLWYFLLLGVVSAALASGQDEKLEAKRDCPNYCSGHGICVSNSCNCDAGYSGSDCSVQTSPLLSGRPLSNQRVDRYRWNYYFINVRYPESTLEVIVNETTTGDADLYIQKNDLPTRNSYYKRDITDDHNMAIIVPNVEIGTWFVGVYGYRAVNYTVKATILGACPNECSGRGSCLNGVCQCNSGYVGEDCAYYATSISANNLVRGNVSINQWNYYLFNFQRGNHISVVLNQLSQGDCDLYIRYDGVPSLWQWTASNISVSNTTSLSLTDPQTGLWFIGVHGFSSCTYTLLVSTEASCPNNCSTHGQCRTGITCSCNTNYNGDYCQNRISTLIEGEVDTGYVDTGNWNYFSYVSNTINDLIVSIIQTNPNGDCDLYARANRQPTAFQYDFSEISTKSSFNMTIFQPGRQTWMIGVYGWRQCTFQIQVVELGSNQCPNRCSGKGDCINAVCKCRLGYTGPDCSVALVPIASNYLKRGESVGLFGWNYYSFYVNDTSSLLVQVREQTTSGFVWLYIGKAPPTLRDYLISDTDDINLIHRLELGLTAGEASTYIIGVYGNPYVPADVQVRYDIIAWAAPF